MEDPPEGEPLPPVDPVEFLGRLRVVLSVLPSDREAHRVSPSNITSNHPLVRNILSNLPPQFRLDLQFSQGVISSLRVRRRATGIGFEGRGRLDVRSGGTEFRAEARTRECDALNGLCSGR